MSHFELNRGNASIIGNVMEDVENADARETLKDFHLRSITPVMVRFFITKLGWLPFEMFSAIRKEAEDMTEAILTETENEPLPSQLTDLFEKDLKKKDQISLLKGLSITTKQLGAIFLQAGKRGYKFSCYRFKGKPKQYLEKDLPSFIRLLDDGSVDTWGKTTLTEGQLRDLIQSSEFLVARILDNGKHWLCFLQNSKSLQGKERGEFGSQPHIHYFSDSFGVTKEDFVKCVKTGHYPPTPVHILLKD